MQIRVHPQTFQSYIFLLLWIHQSLYPKGLPLIMLMGCMQSFLLPPLPLSPLRLMAYRPRGKEDPHYS